MINTLPKISIITITWGHEKYIEETLDSIFMQEYAGPIEYILSNDDSPDNTHKIIEKYLSIHKIPNNFEIKYTNHKNNMGSMKNFIWSLQQAKGKYTAICEGDDYWTDPLKLQKQVDFLENNEDCTICASLAKQELHDKTKINYGYGELDFYVLQDFFTKNMLTTCTVLFRSTKINYNNFSNIIYGDWMLYCSLLDMTKGKVFIMKDILGTYRVHQGGVMNTLGSFEIEKRNIQQIEINRSLFKLSFDKENIQEINKICYKMILHEYYEKKYLSILKVLKKYIFLAKSFEIFPYLIKKKLNKN